MAAKKKAAIGKVVPFVLSTRPVYLNEGNATAKDGGKLSPLVAQKVKTLSRAFLRLDATLTFNQVANEATAPAYSARGPYALFGVIANSLTGNNPQIDGVEGRLLADLMQWKRPGSRVYYNAPLPAKNTTSGPVQNTEDWTLFLEVPVAVSPEDLTGLLLTAATGLQYTFGETFGQASDCVTLNVGSTVSFSGTVTITGEAFELPADQRSWPSLTTLHQLTQFSWPVAGAGNLQIAIPREGTIQRILIEPLIDGTNRDTANAMNLHTIDFTYDGSYHQIDHIDLGTWQFKNQLDHRPAPETDTAYSVNQSVAGNGLYVIDLTTDWPRDALDITTVKQPILTLSFGSAPTQASQVNIVVERLVPLA